MLNFDPEEPKVAQRTHRPQRQSLAIQTAVDLFFNLDEGIKAQDLGFRVRGWPAFQFRWFIQTIAYLGIHGGDVWGRGDYDFPPCFWCLNQLWFNSATKKSM